MNYERHGVRTPEGIQQLKTLAPNIGMGAHRHENGGLSLVVQGTETAGACMGASAFGNQAEIQSTHQA